MTKTIMPQNNISQIRPISPTPITLDERLRLLGEGLTDEQIRFAYDSAETARADFSRSAIAAGVLLLAKKATLGHGQWTPYIERLLAPDSKLAAVLPFSTAESARSIRVYTHLAKRFIAMLESSAWEIPSYRAKLDDNQTAALKTLARQGPEALALPDAQDALSTFLGGRSIRQLQADLLEAVRAAHEEETAPPQAAQTSSMQQPPAARQTDFYDLLENDFTPHLTSLETHLQQPYWSDPQYPHTTKIDALAQIRAKLRDLDRSLADRETALKEGEK